MKKEAQRAIDNTITRRAIEQLVHDGPESASLIHLRAAVPALIKRAHEAEDERDALLVQARAQRGILTSQAIYARRVGRALEEHANTCENALRTIETIDRATTTEEI